MVSQRAEKVGEISVDGCCGLGMPELRCSEVMAQDVTQDLALPIMMSKPKKYHKLSKL
jgi:hypothetical protein